VPMETIKGVHRRTSKGRVYHYHRASGTRLRSEPGTDAFAAEVAALNAAVPPRPAALPVSTLGGLIVEYKRSPEFAALAPDTVKSYQRAFNALADVAGNRAELFTPAVILTIRDGLYRKHGRWLANMVVAVLSVVLGWGVPRGHVASNAAAGVPKVRRARGAGVANPSWTAGEVAAMLDLAKGGMRKGVALAYYTGMRLKDVVEARVEDRRADGTIERTSSKPGVQITVFEAKRLSAILDEAPASVSGYIVETQTGTPFTRDGFQSNFHKLKAVLVKAGALRPGRTFHGLRKSLGRDAAEAGFSENDIAGALGQTSPASARPYTVEARQRAAAKKVMRALERRGKR
jgi:integrase